MSTSHGEEGEEMPPVAFQQRQAQGDRSLSSSHLPCYAHAYKAMTAYWRSQQK